jgi:predicted nucleic-acid-binding Zn-ribbon protein
MPKLNKCPKCDSTKIIPDARVREQAGHEIQVQAHAKPEAKILKKSSTTIVRALICGACGYVELFAPDYQRFFDEHQSKLV